MELQRDIRHKRSKEVGELDFGMREMKVELKGENIYPNYLEYSTITRRLSKMKSKHSM